MFEIVFGIVAAAVIALLATGLILAFFYGDGWVDRMRFPVTIPGWGARAQRIPFDATAADIGVMLHVVSNVVIEGGMVAPADEVRRGLDALRFVWVPATPGGSPAGTERSVRDPWLRMHPQGGPLWVGGWLVGDTAHIVYLPGDRIEDTQLFHEPLHALLDDDEHMNGAWELLHATARERYEKAALTQRD